MANEIEPTTSQPTTDQNNETINTPVTDNAATAPGPEPLDPQPLETSVEAISSEDAELPSPAEAIPMTQEIVPVTMVEAEDVPADDADEAGDEEPSGMGKFAAIGRAIIARILPERYREALRARQAEAFDPGFYEDDEPVAYDMPSDFDVTTTHAMPVVEDSWIEDPSPADSAPPAGKPNRWALAAAFAAVAMTSFVAGGVTSRLSSQMPVLIEQPAKSTESTASLTVPAQPVTTEEPEVAPTPTPTPTTEVQPQQDDNQNVTTVPHGQTQQDDLDDDDEHRWDYNSNSDSSSSNNTDSDRPNSDRDSWTDDYDMDDLYEYYNYYFENNNTNTNPYSTTSPYSTTDPYGYSDSYDSYVYDYLYGYGTGYDTEEDRDSYTWTNRRTTTYDYLT